MALRTNFGTQQYFGFDPRTIPGCYIWNDASTLSNLANGTSVDTWTNSASSLTTSSTGTISNSQLNNRTIVNFTTAQTWTTGSTINLSQYSMFSVMRQTGGTNGRFFQSTTNNQLFGYWNGYKRSFYVDDNPNHLTTALSDTAWDLMSHTRIAGGAYTFKWNGTTLFSGSSSSGNNLTGLAANTGAFPAEVSTAQLAELIVFSNVITSNQVQQIEGYLAWKWGLQTNLPAGHPFKSDPIFQRIPTPLDFGPMLFWWDAAEYSSFTPANPTTGTSITGWRDKINDVTLSNVNSSPTWSSNGVVFTNSSATISASTQNLIYSNTSSPYTTTQNFTIVVAHAPNLFTNNRNAFYMVAPLAFNTNPSFFAAVQNGASEGNSVGAYNATAASWYSLQQAAYVLTTAGAPRVDTILSAPSNFIWTNGTENTYSINNIGRGTTAAGTATITAMSMSASSTVQGNRAYDGTIYEVLVYSSNLSSNAIRQVEGYLGWKWKAYRNLVNTHPFYNIPTSSPLFVPVNLSNCAVWLDAADASTISFSSGSNISQWNDKSGGGFNFSQSTSTRQPTYDATNRLLNFVGNGLQGNASNQALQNTSISVAGTAYSIFVVAKGNSSQPSFTGYNYMVTANTVFPSTRLAFASLNGNFATFTGTGTTWNDTASNTPAVSVRTSTRVWSMVVSGSTLTPYYDGIAMNTKVGTTGSFTGLFIGDPPTSDSGQCWNGSINEVLYYNRALTTLERQQVEGYLAWKWGLQTSLPTTHPYYKFRP
jgi:hypothetical protein